MQPFSDLITCQKANFLKFRTQNQFAGQMAHTVLYPKRGVCADPVDKGAILGEGGGKPPNSDKERQLATDVAGEKT